MEGAAVVAAVALISGANANAAKEKERSFDVQIIAEGLDAPMGIATNSFRTLYYSEVPEPGTPGGANAVKRLDLRTGNSSIISEGEPYPINIALDRRGNVFWTCQTAGVILKYSRYGGTKAPFLPMGFDPNTTPAEDRLMKPTGIAVDRRGDVLFTELPNPGTPGMNLVSVSDGNNITEISDGEPEPTDIVIGYDGTAYWTCKTAGVILRRSPAGVIGNLLDGLEEPTGIALDRTGRYLYFTEIPTPEEFGGDVGPGGAGRNRVVEYDLWKKKLSEVSFGFPNPADVAVAPNGKIYWTCSTAGVIACATPKGGRAYGRRW